MSNNTKMDTSEVFALFETINSKLDKQPNKQIEVAQVDLSAVNILTERLEDVITEVQKPTKVEHRHRHTIDIRSNWFFLSWVGLAIIILILFWTMANQRQIISQYRDNDLKYRYIKMQGQSDEEKIYRLEQQFKYNDSIKIIRKQVERYEKLAREQAEVIERAKRNNEQAVKILKEVESLKNK
ncbi:hypothetical protein FACS189426_22900 [Bacteroidia bacterium]|nr:hypothetical protein FACS189426_22900 [Bacteroidia bacterium]